MFTSRMPIPYPPLDCKTAYIQDNRVLVVPEGVSLAPICVVCGRPSDLVVGRTFHWRQPDLISPGTRELTPLLRDITFLFRRVCRLDDRVALGVPLCSEHRSGQVVRTWVGTALTAIGVAFLIFGIKSNGLRGSIAELTLGGGVGTILGGLTFGFSGANAFTLVEFNNTFAAYQGFGAKYMTKLPQSVEIFAQMSHGHRNHG